MAVANPLCEPGRVELRVCCPQQPVRLISARLTGQIRALHTLWPAAPMRFIFNGAELLEGMTFEFYGIRDGDAIIALPVGERDSVCATNQWLSLTRDNEGFNDSMRWMLDSRTSGEAARLRDIHIMRFEGKSRSFMKLCSPYLTELRTSPVSRNTVTEFEIPSCPLTDPLPALWGPEHADDPVGH
jgi:hypothetical protein